ncbi:MAG: peptidoglycan-binding protein [Candidatus Omnitrophica bacterium]|nr:peptidoglycan-binding protein [Candidatus Omnitrophota bacterium]
MLCVLFFVGCATTTNDSSAKLLQCENHIKFLEEELSAKENEIAQRERKSQGQVKSSYPQSNSTRIKSVESLNSSPSVTQIQKALKKAGYYNGNIDGKMGAKTQDAIMKFQKEHGLKADGKVGPMTWSELKANTN